MTMPLDFTDLGAFGRVPDLHQLLAYLPPRSSGQGPDAARAAAAILRRAAPEEIAWLERNRPAGDEYYSPYPAWAGMKLADVGESPPDPGSGQAAVVALACFHASGFVRERAVRLLAAQDDGDELPFLLLRVNDWVGPVREAAMAALRARLAPAYAMAFVRCLPLVEALRGERRVAHAALLAEIDLLLRGGTAWSALGEALRAGSRPVRRAAARIAATTGDPVLIFSAATDLDPLVAAVGARAITTTWSDGALREVLPRLRRGAAGVRWLAIAATCDRFPGEAEPYLRAALLDRATSVRELGRYRWAKVGLAPLDFAAFYREALAVARGKGVAVALRGLAETGTLEDVVSFERLARDRRAAVRAAAVHGLGRCGGSAHSDALVLAMDDSSARVVAVAQAWVRVRLGRGQVRAQGRAAR